MQTYQEGQIVIAVFRDTHSQDKPIDIFGEIIDVQHFDDEESPTGFSSMYTVSNTADGECYVVGEGEITGAQG